MFFVTEFLCFLMLLALSVSWKSTLDHKNTSLYCCSKDQAIQILQWNPLERISMNNTMNAGQFYKFNIRINLLEGNPSESAVLFHLRLHKQSLGHWLWCINPLSEFGLEPISETVAPHCDGSMQHLLQIYPTGSWHFYTLWEKGKSTFRLVDNQICSSNPRDWAYSHWAALKRQERQGFVCSWNTEI